MIRAAVLRLIAGILLLPGAIATYIGGMVLVGAPSSPAWIVLAVAWACLTLGGGAVLWAWLMTRDL